MPHPELVEGPGYPLTGQGWTWGREGGLSPDLQANGFALISLSNVPLHITELVFNTDNALRAGRAARELSPGVPIGAFFVFTLAAMGVFWFKYRRLTV